MDDGVRPSCFSSSAAFGWGCGATGAELLPLLRARTSRKLTRPAAHSSELYAHTEADFITSPLLLTFLWNAPSHSCHARQGSSGSQHRRGMSSVMSSVASLVAAHATDG